MAHLAPALMSAHPVKADLLIGVLGRRSSGPELLPQDPATLSGLLLQRLKHLLIKADLRVSTSSARVTLSSNSPPSGCGFEGPEVGWPLASAGSGLEEHAREQSNQQGSGCFWFHLSRKEPSRDRARQFPVEETVRQDLFADSTFCNSTKPVGTHANVQSQKPACFCQARSPAHMWRSLVSKTELEVLEARFSL